MGQKNQTVWMHCSSLGEFEQGRPVIEKLKAQDPSITVIVSFFSPSGYEVMKNYSGAEVVCYLPMDSPANAADFISIINPTMVLWVKYEYWFYYLKEIHSRNIPLLLISGIFRPDQPFFKWHGKLHRQMLPFFSHLFVQNEASKALAEKIIPAEKISVSGDTRFDRVISIAEKFDPLPIIENWLGDTQKVLVAGSTWDEDEEVLTHYAKLHPEIKFIIAPHNINELEIKDVLKLFPDATLFSTLTESTIAGVINANSHVLIIDNVGMLAKLYHYATVTYIGGGFGNDGVHNVLEAAVYSKPVVHGPEYEKFAEAKGLIEAGGSFEIEDALELEKVLDKLFTDEAFYKTSATAAGKFVYTQQGATQKVVDYISTLIK
jgi:3-deoxy-D-manno-octulosonic-acid transferase